MYYYMRLHQFSGILLQFNSQEFKSMRRPHIHPPAPPPNPVTGVGRGPNHRRRPRTQLPPPPPGPSHCRRTPTSHLRRPQTYPPPWATVAGTLHPPPLRAPSSRHPTRCFQLARPGTSPRRPSALLPPMPVLVWRSRQSSSSSLLRPSSPAMLLHARASASTSARRYTGSFGVHSSDFILFPIILVQMRFLAA